MFIKNIYIGAPQNTTVEYKDKNEDKLLGQHVAPPPTTTRLIPVYSPGNFEIIAFYISIANDFLDF